MMVARCLAAGAFLLCLLFFSVQPTIGAPLDSPALESSLTQSFPAVTSQTFCPETASTPECAAEYLAVENSGELLPPQPRYEQIHNDLNAIRTAYPNMTLVNHRPQWALGQLVVTLTDAAWDAYRQDPASPFATLAEQYRPQTVTEVVEKTLLLEFAQRYNPEPLAVIYQALDSVSNAVPDGTVGDGSTIRAAPPLYYFDLKWGSCAAGCIEMYTWHFAVTDGVVALIDPEAGAILRPNATVEVTVPDAVTLLFAAGSVTQTTIVTATSQFTPTAAMDDFVFLGDGVRTGIRHAPDAVLAADANASASATSVHLLAPAFQQPYTMTITYNDADWQRRGLRDESTLNVYTTRNGKWQPMLPCAGCAINIEANTITVRTAEITDFALMQRVNWSLRLPIISNGVLAQ